MDIADLAAASYPRPNLKDWTLDDNHLERNIPLDNGRHKVEPEYGLGGLDELPLELLCQVLVLIDMRTLTHFRRINQRAMQVVDSVPQYRDIIMHSPDSVRGALSIDSASSFSCNDLYNTLCTAACEQCGDFGGYIYLLTCRRVCLLCFTETPPFRPLTCVEIRKHYGLNTSHIKALPSMRAIPGHYTPNYKKRYHRLTLVDAEAAHAAALVVYAETVRDRISDASEAPCVPSRPRLNTANDGRSSNPRRFMAVVRAPWLKAPSTIEEFGCHCKGCEYEDDAVPIHWRRKYNRQMFEAHLQQCGPVVDGVHVPT